MRTETFFDILGEVDENLLERAETAAKDGKRRTWKRVSAIAAVFAIMIIGVGTWRILFPPAGAADGVGGGSDNGESWMFYKGPVLPLTSLSDADGVDVRRNIDYDFSSYTPDEESFFAITEVSDRYTLQNNTEQDKTLTLTYPCSIRLNADVQKLPQITVDGKTIEVTYYPGPYSGDYRAAYAGDGGSYNYAELTSFDQYRTLLTDGNYQASAFDALPVLEQSVIVYELTDVQNPANATHLDWNFTVDLDKTQILTYGFNGAGDYHEEKRALRTCTLNNYYESTSRARYLILLGEDIGEYTLQGYLDGGRTYPAEVTATVTRYETTLGEVLLQIIREERQNFKRVWTDDIASANFISDIVLSDELYLGLTAELLLHDGLLSEQVVERYHSGRLEDIVRAVLSNPRILYLTFEVTVPAGSSITVESTMLREPHDNAYGHGRSTQGYDMATTLGSTLTFTEQTASVSNTAAIEIVAQNFGFDLAAGITQVTLDVAQEHYWMEVRRLPTNTTN